MKVGASSTKHRDSQCEVPGEGSIAGVNKPLESSINRTPKTGVTQPGRLFELSASRENTAKK